MMMRDSLVQLADEGFMDDESNTAGLQRIIKVNDLVSGIGSVHDTEGEWRFVASSTAHEISLCRVSIQASGFSSQVEARNDPEADSSSAAVRCRWGVYSSSCAFTKY